MTKNTDKRKYRPQRRAPTPALPASGGDFLDDADQDARARQALSLGAPLDMFDWTSVVTDEVRQHNLDALTRWEAELESTREIKRKNRIDGEPSTDRKRHIALRCLENAQRKLSETPEGRRDDATRDAIYELGKFVNEDYLSAAEVGQAIGDAATVNGLADDRANGALAKVRKDVGRGLAKAKRDGLTVDWTRFDWLYTAADSDESGDRSDEFDEDDDGTPQLAASLLTRSDLRNLPTPEPLIEDVLDRGAVDLLYGRHSSAKTFLALDWAVSVATGRKWQGHNTSQCRVLYIVAEGAYGFDARMAAWECGWQRTVSDTTFSVLPLPVNLTRPAEVAELAALIRWGGYGFVVLDTLARCMVGAEENSAKDVGVVVDAMNTLRLSTPDSGRGVVLGLHHAGKDGKTLRGSSAFESAADTVYFASRDEDNIVTVQREKRRDGPEHDLYTLRLDLIPGTGSGVLSAVNVSENDLSAADKPSASEAKLLSAFMSAFGHVGATKAELRNVAAMPPATFHRALNKLLEYKQLVNTGTDKRPYYMAGQQI